MLKKYLITFLFLAISHLILQAQTPLTTAPNFNVIDARGDYHNLYSYLDNGKYVLLDFFYNECLVCQEHVPEVNDAYIKFGCNTSEVVFMGINFDNSDGEVVAFENEYAIHYPNVSGIEGGGNDIVDLFQVIAFPTIILIAPDKSIPKQDIWPLTSVNIIDELLSVNIDTATCPSLSSKPTLSIPDVEVYPNPATDQINIVFSNNTDTKTIELFDNIGNKVLSLSTAAAKNIIPLHHLMPGYYFLRISQNNENILFKKIILF